MTDTELVAVLAIVEATQLVLLALIYAVAKVERPDDDG